jgi:hypothetical protein
LRCSVPRPAVARDKLHQDARLDLEARAKKLLPGSSDAKRAEIKLPALSTSSLRAFSLVGSSAPPL